MAASQYKITKSKRNGQAAFPKTLVEAVFWDEEKIPLAEALRKMQEEIEEGGSGEAVLYTEQDLTAAEQLQARQNIGIGLVDNSLQPGEYNVYTLLPNILYNLGEVVDESEQEYGIEFLLAPGAEGEVNHYYWTFDTPAEDLPTIWWPEGIVWNGGDAPEIAAEKRYEISVLDGVAAFMETDIPE